MRYWFAITAGPFTEEVGRCEVFGPYNSYEQAQTLVDKLSCPAVIGTLPTKKRDEAIWMLENNPEAFEEE